MGSLANYIGWLLGVIPTLCVLYMVKSNAGEPWRISNLICGMVLVGIAAYMVGLMTGWGDVFELLHTNGTITPDDHAQFKFSMSIWLVIFPATAGGIGVNVISAWLLAKQ